MNRQFHACFGQQMKQMAMAALMFYAFTPQSVLAQSLDNNQGAIELSEPPRANQKVGRKAAERYMGPKQAAPEKEAPARERSFSGGPDAHYLAVHIGGFVSDNAYKWGAGDQTNVGKWNMGVTYRMGEWINSADFGIRLDLASYGLSEGRPTKLSFVPVLMFPDASSKFPLYFGGGIGPGVFLTQLTAESAISLDYQIFAGVRFFDLYRNTGAFIEAGLKNHFLLLSDGQFNGTYAAVGLVFTF